MWDNEKHRNNEKFDYIITSLRSFFINLRGIFNGFSVVKIGRLFDSAGRSFFLLLRFLTNVRAFPFHFRLLLLLPLFLVLLWVLFYLPDNLKFLQRRLEQFNFILRCLDSPVYIDYFLSSCKWLVLLLFQPLYLSVVFYNLLFKVLALYFHIGWI